MFACPERVGPLRRRAFHAVERRRELRDAFRAGSLARQARQCYIGGMAKKPNPPKKPPAKPAASRPATAERARRLDALHRQVREILAAARERAWQAVNTVMVDAYWEVGRAIVEDEQAGKPRASYGKRVLEGLAKRLQAEFGKGYDPSNLRNMRAFFVTYPIREALRRELSWTH